MKVTPEDVIETMVVSQQAAMPCILCGRRTRQRGIFVPGEGQGRELGEPAGKQRLFIYAVCNHHPTNRDTARKCEDKIFEQMKIGDYINLTEEVRAIKAQAN